MDNKKIPTLISKLEKVTGIDQKYFENLQVTRYDPGTFYKHHCDADLSFNNHPRGQRILTVIIYLNTPNISNITQSCTHFTDLKKAIRPKQGKLLMFTPADLKGNIHYALRHEATKNPLSLKYVAQLFVRCKG